MIENGRVLENLKQGFNDEELRTLCFYLRIDYDELLGSGKEAKARELITYCERYGRMDDLLDRCSALRPGMDWRTLESDVPPSGKPLPPSVVMRGYEEFVEEIKEFVRKSQYIEAVDYALKHQDEFKKSKLGNHPQFKLIRAEFDVWHAHALMYTGRLEEAITSLKTVIGELEDQDSQYTEKSLRMRWGIILGRAHNHVGYANWMDLGRYEVALREFKIAINYCALGETADELATAYDNMGRVYAELGYFTRAKFLIGQGREFRQRSPDIRRRDLSLVSSSLAHLAHGEPNHAFLITNKLCDSRDKSQRDRIYGLALLAKARASRYLAAPTYLQEVDSDPEVLKETEKQLWDEAWPIFSASGERIRQFQFYNEIGCIKRERARLLRAQNSEDAPKEINGAIEMLKYGLDEYVNRRNRDGSYVYPAHFLDTCIDLAETYLLAGDRREAEKWLDCGENAIPQAYKLGEEPAILESEDFFEDLWQQLGKASALRGQIAFPSPIPAEIPRDRLPDDIFNAIRYYTFAIGYFGRFLARPLRDEEKYSSLYPAYRPQLANHHLFIERLYDSLKKLSPDYWTLIASEVKTLADRYEIRPTWIQDFYGDTLDFLLQIAKPE